MTTPPNSGSIPGSRSPGRWKPISRTLPQRTLLPSERKLSRRYSAARETVRRALKALAEAGLITNIPGRGWRVY
jgi:DNA-binding GntR family transcriptional regulator